jgi:hypothetical protein
MSELTMMQLILYTTDYGKSQIQLRADLGTVWLTQLEMADHFRGVTKMVRMGYDGRATS